MEWDDPHKKESHRGKTLIQHIEEVNFLFEKLAKFYGIRDEYKEMMKIVIDYHDHGKLARDWNINNPRNPRHAELSIDYMREKGEMEKLKKRLKERYPKWYLEGDPKWYLYLIIYFILKHHSALYDETSSKDKMLKALCEEGIRNIVKKMKWFKRIEYVDSFGLFKLADSLSASGLEFSPDKPNISQKDVEKILLSIGGKLDQERWKEQLNLCDLNNTSILTAHTGWGKTDASLLFFEKKWPKKIFYLFPTITAINKFYEKLISVFGDKVEKYFYVYEYELASKFGESLDETHDFIISSFQASHFLKPIILTTVDQFLLSFLQVGKYYSKRVMFREAGIVFDEVHLLNPKMLALVLHFVEKYLNIYNLKVLFMSATFSEALMRIIQEHIPNIERLDLSSKYKELCRIKYSLEIDKTLFNMMDKIVSFLKEERRILVVFNTVEPAVRFTKELSEIIGWDKVLLIHGRFMYRDREKKEKMIKKIPHVLVATQVCEVSLDISYDMLFTEIAPIPSLVQRFGRVNRYGKKAQMENVYLCKEYRSEDQKRYPYEDEDMKDAKKSLSELGSLNNEYELIKKYNEFLSYERLKKRFEGARRELDFKALWERDERTAYFFSFRLDEEDVKRRLFQLRDEITTSIIPAPECIIEDDVQLKRELKELLDKWELKDLNRDQRQKIYGKLKGYLVPVPIWWVFGIRHDTGFLPVMFKDKVYTSSYGFITKEELENIIA
ncbi:MAG: CRISPR-associated helicase Cas3' [Nitrososphaerales archaeon]